MKIFFRISKLGFGGAEQVFLSLAREFSKIEGVSITFVVDHIKSKNVKTAINDGHRVHNLDVGRTMKSIIPFSQLLKDEKPDVIISAYTDTNAAAILSATLAGQRSRLIVTEHSSLAEHWKRKSKLKKLILKFYVSQLYKLSRSVICVSKGLSGQVSKLLGNSKDVHTIYNPVRFTPRDISSKPEEERERVIQLVAVGRIAEQKDYSTLIRAVEKLNRIRSFHLTIVGGVFCDDEYKKIISLIEKLNVEEYITFAGYTNRVEDYYQKSDIFVLSSAWEGFGNVIIEAMSFGLPIISTNCNYGPAEILEDGKYGRLVNVGDYDDLAKMILAEYEEPLVSKDVLVARSTDFSEQEIAKQYNRVINEVVNGSI